MGGVRVGRGCGWCESGEGLYQYQYQYQITIMVVTPFSQMTTFW